MKSLIALFFFVACITFSHEVTFESYTNSSSFDAKSANLFFNNKLLNELGISKDQKDKIKELQLVFSANYKNLNNLLIEKRKFLNKQLINGASNEELGLTISQISELKSDQLWGVIENRKNMENILGQEIYNEFMLAARKKYDEVKQKTYGSWPLYPPKMPPKINNQNN